ncbi:hypothetical protein JAAARDRAFT_478944 [Jaapia argillacea MUCL 33604]|uniref:CFEM domain-containing protein n=1 Tax=Jaapia argillacea MUCL 33604 TaxID=933084 RepID=A0A067PCB0_9AGAM|nr:hypothetical protein JAAARDRAFT_478944 [Jaapia argillacea MUCL 33604]
MLRIALVLPFLATVYSQSSWDSLNGPVGTVQGSSLVSCAKTCLNSAPIQAVGCDATDCICNGAHFPQAVQAVYSCGLASCTGAADVASATQIASSFCNSWSQTAAPSVTSILTLSSTIYPASGPTHAPSSNSAGGRGCTIGGIMVGIIAAVMVNLVVY